MLLEDFSFSPIGGERGRPPIMAMAAARGARRETSSNLVPQSQAASNDNSNTADMIVETLITWGVTHAFVAGPVI